MTWSDSSKENLNYNIEAEAWNEIQPFFECCGTNGYADWSAERMQTSPFITFLTKVMCVFFKS